MKHLFILLFFTTSLFSFYLSDRLPKESVQLVDSFECFSEDDKTVMYTYLLALQYRMDHVDDREALVKSDLDYWRLWHLVSDMEHNCALDYKFSYILEETITPSPGDKTTLKKLRRVEGSIRTDGSSESSARMSKYDAKLRQKLLQDPPKYTVSAKNKLLNDYNLISVKHHPKSSIPQTVYDAIKKQNLSGTKEDLLLRYAVLKEEMIRKYDRPKERHKIKQEMLYLEECQKYYEVYLRVDFYLNFKRNLANRSVTYNSYYPLKTEFLPKEVESYCEHNITKMEVTPFVVKKEKQVAKKKKTIVLKKSREYVVNYTGDAVIKEKMNTYLEIVTRQLEGKEQDLGAGLQLLRLSSCFKDEGTGLMKSLFQDIKENNLKENFTRQVLQSQMWWATTIMMKMDQEGESEELKHFFDCNQTSLMARTNTRTQTNTLDPKDKPRFSASDMRSASSQRDQIFKYYAGTFENTPTPDMNNKKAIEAGLVSKNMLDANGKIKVPFGEKIVIKGMPKGGLSLTYYGVPKNTLCFDFIKYAQSGVGNIYYNHKTYDGIDYILLNGHKIKTKQYVAKHVVRLCAEEDNNTVAFVKEGTIIKKNYKNRPKLDSAFGNVNRTDETYKIDNKIRTYLAKMPRKYKNSYMKVLSPNGKYLAIGYQGKEICIWDVIENQFVASINIAYKEFGGFDRFLSDNKTLVLSGKKLYFLDTDAGKIVGEIEPEFMKAKKSFSRPRITAWVESPDGGTLYIGSNKNTIERWNIEKRKIGQREISYIDHIENKNVREVGALVFDPRDSNVLIIGSRSETMIFFDTKSKKVTKTFIADERMGCKSITFSDDHQYILAVGGGAFLWRLDNEEQLDIVKGNSISRGVFLPNSSKFATIGDEVSVWEINK